MLIIFSYLEFLGPSASLGAKLPLRLEFDPVGNTKLGERLREENPGHRDDGPEPDLYSYGATANTAP
jgi:hypothetical protein